MEDISVEEMEEDQANIRLSPPQKRTKITAESGSSNGKATNPQQQLIPNHLRHKIYAHKGQCNSVLFLNNSEYLVSGGTDNAIKFWDTRNGALLTKTFENFQAIVCDMAISKDNNLLVAGLTSRNVCIWDTNTGQILQTLKGHQQKVCAVSISKVNSENVILSAAPYDCIKIWSLEYDYPQTSMFLTHSNCNSLCFAAENSLICSGYDHGKIIFTTSDMNHYKVGEIIAHTQPITSLCSMQNGNIVMSSGRDNLHNLVDVRTMQVCRKFKAKGNRVATNWTRTCISPDENFAVLGSADGTVSVWSIQMGKKMNVMKEDSAASVLSCAWSGIGSSLATADSNGTICIWFS